jgi:HEAT repeat protein
MDWIPPTGTDTALHLGLAIALALALLTALLMLQVLVLSEVSARQQGRRRDFDARWLPRLASTALAEPGAEAQAAPRGRERLWFLMLWNRTQRQLRGAARERLNALLVALGLDHYALHLLQNRDKRGRLVALATLRNLADPAHWAQVEPLVREDDIFLSLAAAEALVAMEPARAMNLLLPLASERHDWGVQRVATLCLQAGPAAVTPPLLRELERGGDGERLTELLAWAKPVRVAPWSRRTLDGGANARRRRAALHALGELRDPADRPRILAALADEDSDVRLSALQALRRQATGLDTDLLLAQLADRSWWVRQEAANALVALPGATRDSVRTLLPRVQDRYGHDALERALAEPQA